MQKLFGLMCAVVLSAGGGGCAAMGKMGLPTLALAPAHTVAFDGLTGTGAEEQFVREARLATPPGCAVQTISVLTETEATFTYACFGSDTLTGL